MLAATFVICLCKQFGPRSGPTKSEFKPFDTLNSLIVFLKEIFEKVNFENKSQQLTNAWKITQHAMGEWDWKSDKQKISALNWKYLLTCNF